MVPSRGSGTTTGLGVGQRPGSRSGSCPGPSFGPPPPQPTVKPVFPPSSSMPPFPRSLNPSVVLDPDLMSPLPTPQGAGTAEMGVTAVELEVPLDTKGRAFPYVLPPRFPGAFPTIAFTGPAEHKQREQRLHPLMWVKGGGRGEEGDTLPTLEER